MKFYGAVFAAIFGALVALAWARIAQFGGNDTIVGAFVIGALISFVLAYFGIAFSD